jgi:hypothetical protein
MALGALKMDLFIVFRCSRMLRNESNADFACARWLVYSLPPSQAPEKPQFPDARTIRAGRR